MSAKKLTKRQQWLWFIAIYALSVIGVAGLSYILKLFLFN